MKLIKPLLNLSSAILFTFISCNKDWFNIQSNKTETIPSTIVDFEYLLNNYSEFSSSGPGLGEISSDAIVISESIWQNSQTNDAGSRNQANAYIWSQINPYVEVKEWDQGYRIIFNCNLILEGLEKLDKNKDSLKYKSIKGNAHFIRAWNLYQLSQLFTPQYSKIDNKYGLPLKVNTNIHDKVLRSSIHVTYQNILSDCEIAVELLQEKSFNQHWANKKSALALLARTYLTMGHYDKALYFSNEIIKSGVKLLNFYDHFVLGKPFEKFNEEVLYFNEMVNYYYIMSGHGIDSILYKSYKDEDLRKTLYFDNFNNTITFKGTYNNSTVPFSGLASDEMYLIRAESYARLNQTENAIADVNTLLRSRWNKNENGETLYKDTNITNNKEALKFILAERQKELVLRGTRWTDLRRLNTESDFQKTISRTIGGKTYNLSPSDYKYTFPIPQDEVSLSKTFQNQGWGN